jgi:uncharacterized protein DUF1573
MKHRRFTAASAGIWLVAFNQHCFADLAWERTQIEFQPDPAEITVAGTFKFKNAGDSLVKVKSVKTSCGCTSAGLQKRTYAPGESGEMIVAMHTNGRVSPMRETVRVETDDGKATTLTVRLAIPDYIKVSPGFVFWKRGEAQTPKSFTVDIAPGTAQVKNLTVTSSDPNFSATVVAEQPGRRYRVDLTPKSTDAPSVTTLTIQTDYPKEQPARVFAYAKTL